MADFIKGSYLDSCLEEILAEAKERIILISPQFTLQSRIKEALTSKIEEPRVKITVVFGNSAADIPKSISKEDFRFLAEFPSIEIRHEPRLHAKYYANENKALLSSMPLHDFAQNYNNIEIGILVSQSLIGGITGHSLDAEASSYFQNVIENSDLLFLRTPEFEDKMMGLSKKYITSETEVDTLSKVLRVRVNKNVKG
jgi:hypothetical protein